MLGRGGAERVAGGEDDLLALIGELLGELADGRRLADAIDAQDEEHERLVRRHVQRRGGNREDLAGGLPDPRPDLVGVLQIVLRQAGLHRLEDPIGRPRADVGGEQDLFELVERGLVDLLLAEQLAEPRDEAAAGLREPGLVGLAGLLVDRRVGLGRRGVVFLGLHRLRGLARAGRPPLAAGLRGLLRVLLTEAATCGGLRLALGRGPAKEEQDEHQRDDRDAELDQLVCREHGRLIP